MKAMRASVKELLAHYQVRKTVKQKQRFIQWLKNHAIEHGYHIEEQLYKKGRGRNLIVGNPGEAQLLLTAHYATPPHAIFPILTIIGNIPTYLFSQIFIFVPAIGTFWLLHYLLYYLFGNVIGLGEMIPFFWFEVPLLVFILLILWCFQMMLGFPNRKNANDNTSGVAVLLALLEELSPEQRAKVCFVFFDEEEKGLEGSKNFRKQYGKEIRHTSLFNFDCVAHGKHLMFIRKKEFQESKFDNLLAEVVSDKALLRDSRKNIYPSDQMLFKNSVGVTALHKLPLGKYYLSRLHSRFDSKFNSDNIEVLKGIMQGFIEKVSADDEKVAKGALQMDENSV